MTAQRETLFKNRVMPLLLALPDSWWLKTQERSRRGVPDIIGCIRGNFVAIELKTDTGRVDKLQAWELHRIAKAGGVQIVLRPGSNLDEFIAHLQSLT